MPSHLAINRATDLVHANAGAGHLQRRIQRRRPHRPRAGAPSRCQSHDHAARGIRHVPVLLHGDIQLHQIAAFEASRPGTSRTTSSLMLISTVPGKRYTRAGAERAPCSANTAAATASSCGRRHTFAHVRLERIERQPRDPAGLAASPSSQQQIRSTSVTSFNRQSSCGRRGTRPALSQNWTLSVPTKKDPAGVKFRLTYILRSTR